MVLTFRLPLSKFSFFLFSEFEIVISMFQKADGNESYTLKSNVLNMNSQQSKTKKAVKCEPPEPDNHMADSRFEELQLTENFISPFLSGVHQPEKHLPLQAFKVEPKARIQIHFFQTQLVYR